MAPVGPVRRAPRWWRGKYYHWLYYPTANVGSLTTYANRWGLSYAKARSLADTRQIQATKVGGRWVVNVDQPPEVPATKPH